MSSGKKEQTHRWIASIGAAATDSEDLRLQKSLLVICSIPFIVAGAVWGTMYILFGEILPGLIPLSYSIFSAISLLYFAFSRKFEIYRFSQLFLILLLPFCLQVSLGGFINGSAVLVWSLLSPLGAMLFDNRRRSFKWLLAFVALVAISIPLQSWLQVENSLTPIQISLFFVINIAAVGGLIFLMVYYFVGRKNFYQQRSEALLLNILPAGIAEELKEKGKAEAKLFNSVTVMFTDFKNFTLLAEKLSPAGLVALIDHYFKAFDSIISQYRLEKIKTIGDAYMCAGGLPVPNETHAKDVVRAAIEIQRFTRHQQQLALARGEPVFEIRIGIHTGPVVAGIVGDSKFAYDIWGDTVNLASRMESSGEAGKLNISGSTYELVKNDFHCTYRGKIKAKNKGEVDMYFVALPEPGEETPDRVKENSSLSA